MRSESGRSDDSAYSPGGASGTSSSPSKSFKILWKKAVSRLTRKKSKVPDEPAGELSEPSPLEPVEEANAAGK